MSAGDEKPGFNGPPGLEPLLGVTHLFVERTMTEMLYNAPMRLDIVNNTGEKIFEALATKKKTYLDPFHPHNFLFNIVIGDHDTMLFEMNGHIGKPHAGEEGGISIAHWPRAVYGNVFGHVKELNRYSTSCCWSKPRKTSYNVLDDLNQNIFTLISNKRTLCRNFKTDPTFNVRYSCTGKVVGRISQHWNRLKMYGLKVNKLGVSFPSDMIIEDKGRLLGAILLLYYQIYNEKEFRDMMNEEDLLIHDLRNELVLQEE